MTSTSKTTTSTLKWTCLGVAFCMTAAYIWANSLAVSYFNRIGGSHVGSPGLRSHNSDTETEHAK